MRPKFQKILLLLIFSSFFFGLHNANASRVGSYITIKKGWNLILGFTPASLGGQSLDIKNIRVIFAFIPTTQEYARVYPRPENEKIDKIGDAYLEKTSMWVYSAVDARTEYWLEEPLPLGALGEHKLFRGWNFLGVTPEMVGKRLNDIKGSCQIEKAYGWEPDRKIWNTILDEELQSEAVGAGFVVEVSSNCQFGLPEETLEPPKLPSGGTSNSLAGADYVIKENIKDLRFTGSEEVSPGCPLSKLADRCTSYTARYQGSKGEEFAVFIEIPGKVVTKEQFVDTARRVFQAGDFLGQDYFIKVSGSDAKILWFSKGKIIGIVTKDLIMGSNDDYLEDLLTVYLPKYPSDLKLITR